MTLQLDTYCTEWGTGHHAAELSALSAGPLLYTLFTYDCVGETTDPRTVTSADDTTVMGLNTGEEETVYTREEAPLVAWCQDNNLSLDAEMTKEIVDHPTTSQQQLLKESRQRLYFLRRLKTFGMPTNFYRCPIDCVAWELHENL